MTSSVLTSQFGLAEKLTASASERALARTLDEALEKVEAGLKHEMRFADKVADVTATYLLDAGGKRVRPVLTLLTAQLGDGVNEQVITAAQVVEITHLASLYHDDVMDDAALRRGVPSAQLVWGNSVAVLTGDLLFARASQLIARLGERAIKLQADTFERLCMGQLHETIGPEDGDDPIEHYLKVLADKTGSLIAAAAQFGVVFGGAPAEYEASVLEFGEKVGIAFQLIDDVIDLSDSEANTGKNAGTDLRAGVVTLPLLKLRAAAATDASARELLDYLEQHVIGADESVDVAEGVRRLREHRVTAETLAEAREWAQQAIAALAPLPAGPVKKALIRFADTIVDRSN
ncbi:polyprenyl synthetase family protein [Gryllotalpicola ginsengisoli]|uniref:polyprenyl synthetase family protein n=1 Tax=Gryllotalpicola ginsengisoli TaxID=444608 RepID=UPI0003B5BA22|nr:polyprenyl synthetase family protein [Gryllotalpicola ginsengisoli]